MISPLGGGSRKRFHRLAGVPASDFTVCRGSRRRFHRLSGFPQAISLRFAPFLYPLTIPVSRPIYPSISVSPKKIMSTIPEAMKGTKGYSAVRSLFFTF